MSLAHRILALIACLGAAATTGCVHPLGCGSCAKGPISLSHHVGGCGKCDGCGELYIDPWINHPPECCDPCDTCGNHSGQSCGKCRSVFGGIRTLWGYRCEEGCDHGGQPACGCESAGSHGHHDHGCLKREAACGVEEPACGVELAEPACGIEPKCGVEHGCAADSSYPPQFPTAPYPSGIPTAPVMEGMPIESVPLSRTPRSDGRIITIHGQSKPATAARPASTTPALRPYPQGTPRIFKARSEARARGEF